MSPVTVFKRKLSVNHTVERGVSLAGHMLSLKSSVSCVDDWDGYDRFTLAIRTQ